MNTEQIMKKEKRRLRSLLFEFHVNDKKIKMLEPVIENTAWMKAKLDDTREKIKETSVVIGYDNGGGQKGVRENPLFIGYQKLWRSYISGLNIIMETLPASAAEQMLNSEDEPKNVLQLVRARHKKQE